MVQFARNNDNENENVLVTRRGWRRLASHVVCETACSRPPLVDGLQRAIVVTIQNPVKKAALKSYTRDFLQQLDKAIVILYISNYLYI